MYADIHGDSEAPFDFKYAIDGALLLEHTAAEVEKMNDFINSVIDHVKANKDLNSASALVQNNMAERISMDMLLEGDVKNDGAFSTLKNRALVMSLVIGQERWK